MITSLSKKAARKAYEIIETVRTHWKDELTIRTHGLEICYSTRSTVAKQWFYPRYSSGNNLHEPPISQLIQHKLGANSTFYDVGANVGFFTILGATICNGPYGDVHSFEVDPSLIPLIEESVRLNQTGAVHINCVACADEVGNLLSFNAAQENNPSTNKVTAVPSGASGHVGVQVTTTTLNHYWSKSGASPDLVKIDIEGAEALTVSYMLEMVSACKPELILEVHPPQVREFGARPHDLVHMIQDAGAYEVFEISAYRESHDTLEDVFLPLNINRLDCDSPVVLFFTTDAPLSVK